MILTQLGAVFAMSIRCFLEILHKNGSKCENAAGRRKKLYFFLNLLFFQNFFLKTSRLAVVWSLGLHIPYFCDSRAPRGWFWCNSTRSNGLKSGIHRKKVLFWSPILRMKKHNLLWLFLEKKKKNYQKSFFSPFSLLGTNSSLFFDIYLILTP